MKKLFAFLFGVTLVGQAWAQTTTILRQDDNQTAACYFSSNYFQFDFNNGASFEISYDGVIISSTECSPVEEYSATFGACVRNFVKNGATIEFDLLDGEYSTTQFAHYITRFPVAVSAFAENGIVSIEGSNAIGQTITLTVTPNEDYEFNCWSDGNTDNPRTINITSNMDLKAVCLTEGQTLVNLTVTAGENGTVSGGGVYGSGIAASLRATPNTGYHFVRWSDGNTDNPRTVTVTENATYTAEFEAHTIVIDAAAEPPITLPGYGYTEGSHCSVCGVTINQGNYTYWKQITTSAENGSVSGAGIYHYGQTVALTVTPNEGCTFSCWSDGNTDNPRTVLFDWGSDSDYKAICLAEGQTIANLTVLAAGGNGTVTGGGAFISGTETTFTLQATPNTGYHFVRWSDGNTSNPRTVTITESATFTAEIEAHTVVIDDAVTAGTRPGLTQGSHCSVCNMVIEPQEIIYIIGVYSFEIHGEDYHPEVNHGNDDRFIEPDSPVFAINTYETDVNGWDSQFFIVFANENDAFRADNTISLKFEYKRTGGAALSLIQIHSTPHHDANTFFGVSAGTTEEWQTYEESFEINSSYYSDGYRTIAIDASTGENGTLLLRNIVVKVNGNEVFNTISPTEEFAIVAATNSDTYGSAEVIGKTTYNSEVSLKATPNTGYHFVSWNDGNTENPRTITVTRNAAYTANFEIDNYNVAATADATTGNAYCNASKADYGSNVTFYAIPKYGYFFKNWSNGSTAAKQNVTISGNTTLTAIFEQYPPVIVKDTVIRDTIKVEVEVPVPVEVVKDTVIRDTLKVEVLKTDTLYLQEKIIRDTVFATKTDTLIYYKDVKIVHDTVKIEIAVHDTVLNTVLDTVFNTIHDIVENKIFIHDTIYITKTDTIYLQTSVSDSKAIGLSIYPNPTASFVTVTGEGVFGYVLTNANGKVLRKEEDAASYIVDLSEYADGIYLLHTSDGITHKIVKQ